MKVGARYYQLCCKSKYAQRPIQPQLAIKWAGCDILCCCSILFYWGKKKKKKKEFRQLYQRDQKAKKSPCDIQVLLLSTVLLSVISVGAGLGPQLGEWTHGEFLGSCRLYLRRKSGICCRKEKFPAVPTSHTSSSDCILGDEWMTQL